MLGQQRNFSSTSSKVLKIKLLKKRERGGNKKKYTFNGLKKKPQKMTKVAWICIPDNPICSKDLLLFLFFAHYNSKRDELHVKTTFYLV